LSRSAHVSAILTDSHWLTAPERIGFKLAVITNRCLHATVSHYLTSQLRQIADIHAQRRFRSSAGESLDVRPSRLTTIGNRVFATAAPQIWNCLPASVKAAPSLTAFCSQLRAHLIRKSFT
jgi:hypothetical protein